MSWGPYDFSPDFSRVRDCEISLRLIFEADIHTYVRTDGRSRDYQRARELSKKGSYGDFSDRYYGVKNTDKITSFLSIFVRFSAFLASFSSAVVFSTTGQNQNSLESQRRKVRSF